MPLLYQSVYLTIASYDDVLKSYRLHFPNYEVSQGMAEVLTNYLMDTDNLERDDAIYNMAKTILEIDLAAAVTHLRSWIASIPYDIITKKE